MINAQYQDSHSRRDGIPTSVCIKRRQIGSFAWLDHTASCGSIEVESIVDISQRSESFWAVSQESAQWRRECSETVILNKTTFQ
jgi:hypothetical protein